MQRLYFHSLLLSLFLSCTEGNEGAHHRPFLLGSRDSDVSRRRELSKAVLMGRKKQKVRWTSVEDAGFFETDLVTSEVPNNQNQEVLGSNPTEGNMQQKTNQSSSGSDSTGNYVR